jgi:hypothetical protein
MRAVPKHDSKTGAIELKRDEMRVLRRLQPVRACESARMHPQTANLRLRAQRLVGPESLRYTRAPERSVSFPHSSSRARLAQRFSAHFTLGATCVLGPDPQVEPAVASARDCTTCRRPSSASTDSLPRRLSFD